MKTGIHECPKITEQRDKDEKYYGWRDDDWHIICGNPSRMTWNEEDYEAEGSIEINYCPFCGEELKNE